MAIKVIIKYQSTDSYLAQYSKTIDRRIQCFFHTIAGTTRQDSDHGVRFGKDTDKMQNQIQLPSQDLALGCYQPLPDNVATRLSLKSPLKCHSKKWLCRFGALILSHALSKRINTESGSWQFIWSYTADIREKMRSTLHGMFLITPWQKQVENYSPREIRTTTCITNLWYMHFKCAALACKVGFVYGKFVIVVWIYTGEYFSTCFCQALNPLVTRHPSGQN